MRNAESKIASMTPPPDQSGSLPASPPGSLSASRRDACACGPGRPRGFDADTALGEALTLFWRQGYEQTSIEDLIGAMGISRSSFYACFKSKHGALLAAVERYCEQTLCALRAAAEAQAEPAAAARAVIRAIAAPEAGREGCFLANCVSELAPHDPEIEALLRRQLERTEALIAGLLSEAEPVPGGAPAPDGRAAALLSLALGATTLRKAGTDPARLAAVLAQADRLIDD